MVKAKNSLIDKIRSNEVEELVLSRGGAAFRGPSKDDFVRDLVDALIYNSCTDDGSSSSRIKSACLSDFVMGAAAFVDILNAVAYLPNLEKLSLSTSKFVVPVSAIVNILNGTKKKNTMTSDTKDNSNQQQHQRGLQKLTNLNVIHGLGFRCQSEIDELSAALSDHPTLVEVSLLGLDCRQSDNDDDNSSNGIVVLGGGVIGTDQHNHGIGNGIVLRRQSTTSSNVQQRQRQRLQERANRSSSRSLPAGVGGGGDADNNNDGVKDDDDEPSVRSGTIASTTTTAGTAATSSTVSSTSDDDSSEDPNALSLDPLFRALAMIPNLETIDVTLATNLMKTMKRLSNDCIATLFGASGGRGNNNNNTDSTVLLDVSLWHVRLDDGHLRAALPAIQSHPTLKFLSLRSNPNISDDVWKRDFLTMLLHNYALVSVYADIDCPKFDKQLATLLKLNRIGRGELMKDDDDSSRCGAANTTTTTTTREEWIEFLDRVSDDIDSVYCLFRTDPIKILFSPPAVAAATVNDDG